jgi:hypothetical protein
VSLIFFSELQYEETTLDIKICSGLFVFGAGVAQSHYDYGLDDRGSIPDRGKGFFSWCLRPDRLWGPYPMGSFPRGQSAAEA